MTSPIAIQRKKKNDPGHELKVLISGEIFTIKASGTDLKVQVFSGFPLAFLEKLEKKKSKFTSGDLVIILSTKHDTNFEVIW